VGNRTGVWQSGNRAAARDNRPSADCAEIAPTLGRVRECYIPIHDVKQRAALAGRSIQCRNMFWNVKSAAPARGHQAARFRLGWG
jgi:hypothetical protein